MSTQPTVSGSLPTASATAKAVAQARALALIRAIVGVVFLAHGSQKLFGFGIHGVAGFLGQIGIPLPGVAAIVLTFVEFLGGAALLLGVFTRIAAGLLAIDMLVAVLKVHAPHGFFLPQGCEYALSLLIVNIALFLAGPGAWAIDNKLFGKRG